MVRNALLVLAPRPCTVPNVLGWGAELLIRRMVPGMAKVRAPTCSSKTSVMPNQSAALGEVLEFASATTESGFAERTRSDKYGARKYASGKTSKDHLVLLSKP